ncbi:MAG TPA: hypothetical protein VFR85_07315 [Anaeromyxobacteraceae bacterium]|nr:hypothetical protein [Anaeromyxobacteraceae bacterium]
MLRVTDDVLELRRWAESRGGWPCRDPATGRLAVAFPGDVWDGVEIGWDEFEPTFCSGRCVFVYDDAWKSHRCFVGSEAEARAFVSWAMAAGAAPPSP